MLCSQYSRFNQKAKQIFNLVINFFKQCFFRQFFYSQIETQTLQILNSSTDAQEDSDLVAVTYLRLYYADWVYLVRWLANLQVRLAGRDYFLK